MNTEYLKEFVVLAETKNFWEASQRLYMNQSTLSKHIKSLENELGVELFTRSTRKVALTRYGDTFLPYARTIIKADREGLSAIQQLKNIEEGLLTIGSIPAMPQYGITSFLSQFQKNNKDATIRISEDDSSNLITYLMNGNCEFIFLRENQAAYEYNVVNDKQIKRIPYMQDHMVVLMKKNHPLAKEETMDMKQLKEEQFCLIKEGSVMHDMTMNACQMAGFIPNIIFTSHRLDCILDMVKNQNCVALLMDKHIPLQEMDSLTTVKMIPEITSQISLCYRTDQTLSTTAQKFLDFYISTINKEKMDSK